MSYGTWFCLTALSGGTFLGLLLYGMVHCPRC